MPDAIPSVWRAGGLARVGGPSQQPLSPKAAQAPGFTDQVGGLIHQVNALQHEASQAIDSLATGQGDNLHEVMLAVNKAELSFKFLMETRNKLVEAYQEVMRMQI